MSPRSTLRRGLRRFRTIPVILLVVALLTPLLAAASAQGSTVGRPTGLLVPQRGALFGTWITRGGGSQAELLAALAEREAQMGRLFDVNHHFYTFTATFPTWREQDDIAKGRIPMISWNGGDALKVISGQYDSLITQRADAVKALGVPVFLRYFWEPEAKMSVAYSTDNYIAAWRHIHDIFEARGVDNAAWVWCPTAWGMTQGTSQAFYPGDEYVDWVGSDGYNWAPGKAGSAWRTFEWTYQPTHDFAVQRNKPMMAGEYGVQERNAGEKAAWLREASTAIKNQFPYLAAVVYFDENRLYDWRVDSTPESLAAFVELARDPYFNPRNGPELLFEDGFDNGALEGWQWSRGVAVTAGEGVAGTPALVGATTAGRTSATALLAQSVSVAATSIDYRFSTLPNKTVRLLALHWADDTPAVSVAVRTDGRLTLRDHTGDVLAVSSSVLDHSAWHNVALEYDGAASGGASLVVDGQEVARITRQAAASQGAVTGVVVGDRGGQGVAKTYRMLLDNVEVLTGA